MDTADAAGAVRPTIILAGKTWRRQRFTLLSAEPEVALEIMDLDKERNSVRFHFGLSAELT